MLWRQLASDFLRSRERGDGTATKQCRPKTIRAYASDTERFVLAMEARGVPEIGSLTKTILRDHIEEISQLRWAPASRNKYWRSIRAFLRWIENDDESAAPLAKLLPKIPRGDPREFIPAMDTIRALRNALRPTRLAEHRDYAILTLLLDCGMRIGEVSLLELSHLEALREGLIQVPRLGKTGVRIVPISKETVEMLRGYLKRRGAIAKTQRVFVGRNGKPISPDGLGQAFRRYRRRVPGCKITPHSLRHAFATYFLSNGGDLATLQQITGHKSLEQLSWYLHRSGRAVASVHRTASPLKRL
jgi:integrase/recombinase XerD